MFHTCHDSRRVCQTASRAHKPDTRRLRYPRTISVSGAPSTDASNVRPTKYPPSGQKPSSKPSAALSKSIVMQLPQSWPNLKTSAAFRQAEAENSVLYSRWITSSPEIKGMRKRDESKFDNLCIYPLLLSYSQHRAYSCLAVDIYFL